MYTAAYQNRDTKTLDERFGLTGETVPKESDVAQDLSRAIGYFSLGQIEVEAVLGYFTRVAKQAGNFVGLLEEEVRKHVRDRKLTSFSEGEIDVALRYCDGMHEGANYLKRITVEGRDVLFPANLQQMLF